MKNTSFHIQYEIVNQDNITVAEAQDVIVLYDYNKNSKLAIPEDIKRKIEALGK